MGRGIAKILIVAALAMIFIGYFTDAFGLLCMGAGASITLSFVELNCPHCLRSLNKTQ